MQDKQVERLSQLLGAAQRIFAFSGAGISTGSNIPDFRGPNGVFKDRAPVYYQEFAQSDRARREYWAFKLEGYPAFRDALPNAGHEALVRLEALGKLELLATQNVDGLHQAAGTSEERLVELHGSNRQVQCDSCGKREQPERCMSEFAETGKPPCCLHCGGWMKPAVVMFGQSLSAEGLRRAQRASLAADLVLALGSSLVVTPAADLPLLGVGRGAPYVIINQGATPHDGLATLRIDGDVAHYLAPAVERLS
jgi:NAD-dependent deacetylase